MGIESTEFGPVGKAEPVQLVITEDAAKDVHVAHGVLGADRSSESSIAIEAPLGNAIGSGEQCSSLTGGVGRDVGPIPAQYLLVGEAGDGCGLSDSAWIESDDVVDRSNI